MSLARSVLNFVLLLVFSVSAGCSISTAPTYHKHDLDTVVEKILREEYKTEVYASFYGGTLWIYIPVESLFDKTPGNDPKDKVKERFEIQENESSLRDGLLSVSYLVRPVVPERERDQGYKLNKQAMEKINNAWEAMRRIVFSMDRKERDEVRFYVLAIADITTGFELQETIYYKDLIKALYRIISPGEYHHRVPVKSGVRLELVGDKEGRNIPYHDIDFNEFLCRQIEHRIGLKFQKPEVESGANTDKEIQRAVLDTLKIYGFSEFRVAELTNLLTNGQSHLDPGDVRDFRAVR